MDPFSLLNNRRLIHDHGGWNGLAIKYGFFIVLVALGMAAYASIALYL
jgi:Flp pilus assembly pilin Flp